MKVVYSDLSLKHQPKFEISNGRQIPYFECPSRLTLIKAWLSQFRKNQYEFLPNNDFGMQWIYKAHSREYVEYLQTAYAAWVADGGNKDGVLPEAFAVNKIKMKPGKKVLSPVAKAGMFCFDMSCTLTEDTWTSIYESVQCTLTAAQLLIDLTLGEGADKINGVFSLCRPPGHHAQAELCGGYCYINNVAVATKYIIEKTSTPEKQTKVAILDIDYHFGNGTSSIFYNEPLLYVSLHGENDYPWFAGDAEDIGEGSGEGYNVNIPLPKDTDDITYCKVLHKVIEERIKPYNADWIVCSLGVDTYCHDPIGGFDITTQCYKHIGRIIRSIGKNVLFVLEGGYDLAALGENVGGVLEGFERSEGIPWSLEDAERELAKSEDESSNRPEDDGKHGEVSYPE